MTEKEIETIDYLLDSNLHEQRFSLRMANVRWRRMQEKEAHLDKHQHSKEFFRAYGNYRYAKNMVAAYETLIRFWEKERSLHQDNRGEKICGARTLAKP